MFPLFIIAIAVLAVILSVALMTLTERKVMAALQRRMGPVDDFRISSYNYWLFSNGLFQPFVDGIKLVLKESVVPLESSNWLFIATPFLAFYLALLNWLVLPLDEGLVLSELVGGGILVLVANSELSIYGVILSGWSANSKYPFIGSLRSTAQMISYSCSISLLLLCVALVAGSIDLMLFIEPAIYLFWCRGILALPLLPVTLLFAVCLIAETNRAPFDLPEAESELVAGFFTEHSAVTFAYFFLGEFTNILAMATLLFVLFFGVSLALPFVLFVFFIRASFARLRFDQLLYFSWKVILPFAMCAIIFLLALLVLFLCGYLVKDRLIISLFFILLLSKCFPLLN